MHHFDIWPIGSYSNLNWWRRQSHTTVYSSTTVQLRPRLECTTGIGIQSRRLRIRGSSATSWHCFICFWWTGKVPSMLQVIVTNVCTLKSTQRSIVSRNNREWNSVPNLIAIGHPSVSPTRTQEMDARHETTSLLHKNQQQSSAFLDAKNVTKDDMAIPGEYGVNCIEHHMDTLQTRKYMIRWYEYGPRDDTI